jgi:hypothetical protein
VSTLPTEPWRQLPPEVAGLIRPELPALRDEILEVIAAEVAEYARPLEGSFGRGIRMGVEQALGRFADLIADPDSPQATGLGVYAGLGAGEVRQGRTLDALQAAYRVGARVAWRRLAAVGLTANLAPATLCDLADAIFAYIDELAASSVEGYALAQQTAAGERERRRRLVLTALLADPFEADALRRAAAVADWRLPQRLAVLVCEPDALDEIARRMTADALPGVVEGVGCLAVPDPDGPGRGAMIATACGEHAAVLGPAREPDEMGTGFARARSALDAVREGILPAGLVVLEEHLAEAALFDAREAMHELASSRLAPVDELPPGSRERMVQTLRAYLHQRGNAAAMARELHLHPQTVRYRLRQLRDLFGEDLDNPQARFELELSLRS